MIISRSVLLRMRNFSEKNVVEEIKTHILRSEIFFQKSCLYEIMWKNIVELSRPQMTI